MVEAEKAPGLAVEPETIDQKRVVRTECAHRRLARPRALPIQKLIPRFAGFFM